MKRALVLSVFLSLSLFVHSQQKVEVEIGEKNMSKGPQMAVTVLIPETKAKAVEPLWKRYVNNRGLGEVLGNLATQIGNVFKSEENKVSRDKLKVEKKGDELYVRAIKEASISRQTMDVYARMTDVPEGCQFSAFFQHTDSVFINESNVDQERIQNMKSYIRDFGVIAYKSAVDDQIKVARKEVSKQERVMKKIKSGTRKAEKSIVRFEVDIQEYESGIKGIENDIARLDETIETKKYDITSLTKGTPEYEIEQKALSEFSKEKSKNFKEIKSLKRKIKGKEMDIKSAKGRISKNESQIIKQSKTIEDKESIVDQLVRKKEAIQ